jgi:4-hydroxybenzoate polyprenyltransferase
MPPTTAQPTGNQARRGSSGRRLARRRTDRGALDVRRTLPVVLARAAHPRQALLTTVVLTGAAAMAGRSLEEVGLVAATVLIGQVILGWHNDVVDAQRDREHARPDKPVALEHVDRGTVTFAIAVAVLAVVPLSIANGMEAGLTHLGILAVAMLTNAGVLRRSRFSYLPWMVTFGLFPAFLSYGGWAGVGAGGPPTIALTLLAALLGIGVHVLRSLPGLVDDNKDGLRTFPLRIALKTGAPRLLLFAGAYTAAVSVGILIAALGVGLVQ